MPKPLQLRFKGKAFDAYAMDGTRYRALKLPTLTTSHVPDRGAWRQSRAWGGLANSDLFPQVINSAAKRALGDAIHKYDNVIRLDRLPEGCTAETGGFLTTVTITVPDVR